MMVLTELHSLHVGDHFSFSEGTAELEVQDTDMIGYLGEPLVYYQAADGPHAHIKDHTPVWVD